ncbi:hypothetical protein [Butyricicoccus sp. Marseille-Q5471]|uniref:hypothetical protein n=1 Tax=Butyricicoccus sp. Marseille-Q5471 TaxID=3039493 RepID=UPI0024BD4BE0|nr:hypothetical protein [Butyricicoccus sp. Marseille-Q5471]
MTLIFPHRVIPLPNLYRKNILPLTILNAKYFCANDPFFKTKKQLLLYRNSCFFFLIASTQVMRFSSIHFPQNVQLVFVSGANFRFVSFAICYFHRTGTPFALYISKRVCNVQKAKGDIYEKVDERTAQ